MRRNSSRSGKSPTLHTAIIGDVGGMWSKLAWDVDVCRDVQTSYPNERQPLAYAAINVCIAAWSLQNWVNSAAARQARARGEKFDKAAYRSAILDAIPEQAMCEAIANTAKHAHHKDEVWPGGQARLEWQEGDEDAPPGFLLHYADGLSGGLAVNRFISLCDNWWAYLIAHGFADGVARTPEWQQNKLRRIFGATGDRILPPGAEPLSATDVEP